MADLEAIRRDNPLPEVVGNIIALKPAGREWVACCPFHADRSPSFTIFDRGQRFHCFGCGASGDVLDFVQRAYGVALPEAARMLGAGDVPKLDISKQMANFPRCKTTRLQQGCALYLVACCSSGWNARRGLFAVPGHKFPLSARCAILLFPATISGHCLALCWQCGCGREVTGIQRIWLASDGMGKADVPKPYARLAM